MVHEQSKVPACPPGGKCKAFEENPREFAEQEICPGCIHHKKINNWYLVMLLHYFKLQNADCPVGRHELTDYEWIDLGQIKAEWTKLEMEWHKAHPRDTD